LKKTDPLLYNQLKKDITAEVEATAKDIIENLSSQALVINGGNESAILDFANAIKEGKKVILIVDSKTLPEFYSTKEVPGYYRSSSNGSLPNEFDASEYLRIRIIYDRKAYPVMFPERYGIDLNQFFMQNQELIKNNVIITTLRDLESDVAGIFKIDEIYAF